MLSFYIIFGDRNPPYPALGSNIPSVRRPGQWFHFLLCRGSSPSTSLLKQAWRNPKEGRVGCLHQNIFTRKVTDIAFTSDFCDNHSHPASPASLFLTSPRPRPTRPRVPYLMSSSPASRVPKSQVPTHPSRCPRPLVPVPLLYTAPPRPRNGTVGQRLDKQIISFSFILPRNLLHSLFQAANISLRCTLCTDAVLFFCSFFSKTSASARERARSATTSPEREEVRGVCGQATGISDEYCSTITSNPEKKKSLIADNSNFFSFPFRVRVCRSLISRFSRLWKKKIAKFKPRK